VPGPRPLRWGSPRATFTVWARGPAGYRVAGSSHDHHRASRGDSEQARGEPAGPSQSLPPSHVSSLAARQSELARSSDPPGSSQRGDRAPGPWSSGRGRVSQAAGGVLTGPRPAPAAGLGRGGPGPDHASRGPADRPPGPAGPPGEGDASFRFSDESSCAPGELGIRRAACDQSARPRTRCKVSPLSVLSRCRAEIDRPTFIFSFYVRISELPAVATYCPLRLRIYNIEFWSLPLHSCAPASCCCSLPVSVTVPC
jgi:hypothetical protein